MLHWQTANIDTQSVYIELGSGPVGLLTMGPVATLAVLAHLRGMTEFQLKIEEECSVQREIHNSVRGEYYLLLLRYHEWHYQGGR